MSQYGAVYESLSKILLRVWTIVVKCSRLTSCCCMHTCCTHISLPTAGTTHTSKYGTSTFQNKLETQDGANRETNLCFRANTGKTNGWCHDTVSGLNPMFSPCDYACPEFTEHTFSGSLDPFLVFVRLFLKGHVKRILDVWNVLSRHSG